MGENNYKTHLLKSLKKDLEHFLNSGHRLTFKASKKPKVSIIIPTFNGAHHTLRCLLSLINDQKTSFEIIIFDNGSTDKTAELLARCDNIKVIMSPQNLGYIEANNAAATQARGDFLLLLNNDARIAEGAIEDSVEVFSSQKNVGAVGVRIKLATGKLQEAGCMIFQDGTSNGYLRYSDPEDPRAMFMRDVDYCSGIYLLMRRQQFLDLGGLDEIFAPAYYEETDLCMKLRRIGLRVIYFPLVVVEHFEFGSQPSKVGRGAILERRPIFINRWKHELATHGFSANERAASTDLSSRRLVPRPRILFLAHQLVLDEMTDSAKAIVLAAVKRGFHVMLFGVAPQGFSWDKFHDMFGLGVEISLGSSAPSLRKLLKARPRFFDLVSNLEASSPELLALNQVLIGQHVISKLSDIPSFEEKLDLPSP